MSDPAETGGKVALDPVDRQQATGEPASCCHPCDVLSPRATVAPSAGLEAAGDHEPQYTRLMLDLILGLVKDAFLALMVVTLLMVVAGVVYLLREAAKETTSPRDQIDAWAREHSLRVVEARRRFVRTGPYFFAPELLSPRRMMVYRATLEDQSGTQRKAWLSVSVFRVKNPVDAIWDV